MFDQRTIDDKRSDNRVTRDVSDFNAVLLAIAAHDMRQPLQAILSCYDRLAGRHNDERERNYLEYGKQAINGLIDQLDRLIEALRIHERGADVGLGLVDVQAIFAKLQRDSTETAAQKGVELRVVRTAATVVSDAVLLESILSNLVRNALKYTLAGGRVLLGCRRQGSQFALGCMILAQASRATTSRRYSRHFAVWNQVHRMGLASGSSLFDARPTCSDTKSRSTRR